MFASDGGRLRCGAFSSHGVVSKWVGALCHTVSLAAAGLGRWYVRKVLPARSTFTISIRRLFLHNPC
jgi:hypothetical protein